MNYIIEDIALSLLLLELGYRIYQKYSVYVRCWWLTRFEEVKEYSDNTLNEDLKKKYDDL